VDPWWQPLQEAAGRNVYTLLVQADGSALPIPHESFPCAMSNSVLEHIPHVEAVLNEVGRALQPGGMFYFAVPNQHFRTDLWGMQMLIALGLHSLAERYEHFFNHIARHVNLDPPESMACTPTTSGILERRILELFSQVGHANARARTCSWTAQFTLEKLFGNGCFSLHAEIPFCIITKSANYWMTPFAMMAPALLCCEERSMSAVRKWGYYAWSVIEMAAGFRSWGLLLRAFLTKQPLEKATLRFWRQSTRLQVRGAMDIWSVKETFLDQFYIRYGTPIEPNWRIVRYWTRLSVNLRFLLLKGLRMVWFMPSSLTRNHLRSCRKYRLERLTNVHPYGIGVWERAGNMQLELVNGEPLQGKTVFQQEKKENKAEIPVITFDQLCRIFYRKD